MSAPRDRGPSDYFCRMLDRFMPWRGGYASVLESYFDASQRGDNGVFCVAGFAFGYDRAKKAVRDWRRLCGETRAHMSDMSQTPPVGDFAGWTKEQARERIEAEIPLVNRWAQFGVAVSVDIAEFNRFAPKSSDPDSKPILDGFSTPFAFCSHMVMAIMRRLTNCPDIAYFFEKGDRFQGQSSSFVEYVAGAPEIEAAMYGARSHTFLKSSDCRLFEMSDIFAWEWSKHVERVKKGSAKDSSSITRQRPSLTALLGNGILSHCETDQRSDSRIARHFTAEDLDTFFRKINDREVLSDKPTERAILAMFDDLTTLKA